MQALHSWLTHNNLRCTKITKFHTVWHTSLAMISILFSLVVPHPAYAEIIDIKSRPEALPIIQKLEELLPKPGNKGAANIESLTFDTEALEIAGTAKIIAKHSWGRFAGYKVEAQKTFKAKFTYNLETQRIRGDISLGKIELGVKVAGKKFGISFGEVKVDLERLQRALEGDLIAILELFPTPDAIQPDHRNEYENIRQSKWDKYGRGNVYFASREFVNWASSAKVATWIGEGIITGGASVSLAFAEIQAESLKELSAVTMWLQEKGVQEAEDIALKILSGEQVEWPFIKVEWQSVKYEIRHQIAGNPITPWVADHHGAFYLVWIGGDTSATTETSTSNTTAPENASSNVTPNHVTLNCNVKGVFSEIWAQYSNKLGCDIGWVIDDVITYEPFEHGYLVWVKYNDKIFFLPFAQPWSEFPNTWTPAENTISCDAAHTQGRPIMGFGKLWCNNPTVSGLLGNALDGEYVLPNASLQYFETGLMFTIATGETVILFQDGNWVRH